MNEHDKIILLYDGYCNFCTSLVFRLKKIDKKGLIDSLPASTEKGQEIINKFSIDEDLTKTLGLVKQDKVFFRSDAVFEIFESLGGIWHGVYIFKRIFPRKFRDSIYMLIARNRYKIFGKHESCKSV